jgi:hypothetical protein
VLVRRSPTLGIPLHARRVLDAELPGQVLHDLPRHRQRIIPQESADVADRPDLHRHAQPVPVRTTQRNQVPVVIVEEEETLQLRTGRNLG